MPPIDVARFVHPYKKREFMGIVDRFLSATNTAAWVPWLVLGAIALYLVGYVDGGAHAVAPGSPAFLNTVHEFFHHARHVAFMCH